MVLYWFSALLHPKLNDYYVHMVPHITAVVIRIIHLLSTCIVTGVLESGDQCIMHKDVDAALEWCEDRLIQHVQVSTMNQRTALTVHVFM
jgi:hypothetical protein